MTGLEGLLHGIPWWVYLVVLYVVKAGMKGAQAKVVPLKKLLITPIIFGAMSVHSFLEQPMINALIISLWLGSILLGGYLGWRMVIDIEMKVDRTQNLVKLPGSWSTMAVMVLIIAGKFYVGYELATNHGQTEASVAMLMAFVLSGLCTGILIGRVMAYLYRFNHSKSVPLLED